MNLNFVTVFVIFFCSISHKTVYGSTISTHNCSFEDILKYIKFEKTVNPTNLEEFIKSAYENENRIPSKNAFSSFFASHYLDIKQLLAEREQLLSSQLSVENVVDFYVLSSDLKFNILKQNCENLFRKEYKNIFENNKLLSLNFEEIKEILQIMKVGNEKDEVLKQKIFGFVISWVEKDSQSRKPFLLNLLEIIPFQELSHCFLIENVLPHSLMTDSPESSELLNNALNKTYYASLSANSFSSSHSGSQLYCMGGWDENSIAISSFSQMNSTSKEWKKLPEMSTPRSEFGATVIDKKIYIWGGRTKNGESNLEVFDFENNTWSQIETMETKLYHFGMTALNGVIIVAGGWNGSNSFSSVFKFSLETNTWTEVMPMNQARDAHELVTLNDMIYAIGGRTTTTVERYNLSTDEWSYVASTHNRHSYFGATLHQNKIYILSYEGFEVYDPHSNVWQELPKLKIGTGTQLVSINDKLWAVGGGEGNDRYKASKKVFEFDTTKNTWFRLPDMDVARMDHRAVVINV